MKTKTPKKKASKCTTITAKEIVNILAPLLCNSLNLTGESQIVLDIELNHAFFKTDSKKERRNVDLKELLTARNLIEIELKDFDYVFVGLDSEWDEYLCIQLFIIATSDEITFLNHADKIKEFSFCNARMFSDAYPGCKRG